VRGGAARARNLSQSRGSRCARRARARRAVRACAFSRVADAAVVRAGSERCSAAGLRARRGAARRAAPIRVCPFRGSQPCSRAARARARSAPCARQIPGQTHRGRRLGKERSECVKTVVPFVRLSHTFSLLKPSAQPRTLSQRAVLRRRELAKRRALSPRAPTAGEARAAPTTLQHCYCCSYRCLGAHVRFEDECVAERGAARRVRGARG
jgi:hypothetical protein